MQKETILRYYPGSLNANETKTFEIYGDYIFLLANSGVDGTLKISFDNNGEVEMPVGTILKLRNVFNRVFIRNTDTVATTFKIMAGQGDIDYKALVLSGNITTTPGQSNTGANAADVTTGAAAKIVTGAANYGVIIQASDANTANVFIGFANTVSATNKVIALAPGQIYVFDKWKGDIWAFSAAPQTISVTVMT